MGQPQSLSGGRFRLTRVSIGTMLVVGGCVYGVLVGVPKTHQTLSQKQTPIELRCVDLLRDGVPAKSSIITLTDAEVHAPDPILAGASASADQSANGQAMARVKAVLAHPKMAPLVDRLVRGSVLPRGVTRQGNQQPLQLSHGQESVRVAQAEIQNTGQLTLLVSKDNSKAWISSAANLFNLTLPEKFTAAKALPSYSLHPVSQIGSTRDAAVSLVLSMLAVAVGLVLCGSVSIGWWVILSPLGGLLGLPGIPLRRANTGKLTWLASLVFGFGSIAASAYLAWTLGKIGQVGGEHLWQTSGFFAASIGSAAILGTFLSIRFRRQPSVEDLAITPVKSTKNQGKNLKKRAAQQVVDASKPSGLESMLAPPAYSRRYLDPRMSVLSYPQLSQQCSKQTEALEKAEFEAPLIVEIARGEETSVVTLQLGCENLVLAMTDEFEDNQHLRMVSILEDGHVILSADSRCEDSLQEASENSASVRIFTTDKATKLLAKHLETAAALAKKRKTRLLTVDSNEWRDLVLYTDRCVADALHHLGTQKWDISDEHYGRFQFPAQSVPLPTLV